ncbi:MAG: hypothetical protein ABEJ07_04935 [Candidatus Nanohaloarchaea archaeon]
MEHSGGVGELEEAGNFLYLVLGPLSYSFKKDVDRYTRHVRGRNGVKVGKEEVEQELERIEDPVDTANDHLRQAADLNGRIRETEPAFVAGEEEVMTVEQYDEDASGMFQQYRDVYHKLEEAGLDLHSRGDVDPSGILEDLNEISPGDREAL